VKNKIGIIVISISFLAALNPFLLIYALPIFVVGLIWLWLGNRNLPYKIAWTITPILLWYPCMNIFVTSYMSFQELTRPRYDFIFPANFEGTAVIVEDMQCAENPKKSNGRIVLEFPDNGILLYRSRLESSHMDNKYYKADSTGILTELIDFHWAASASEKSEQKRHGVKHRYSAVGNLYLPDRHIYTYSVFTVGPRDDKYSIILTQEKEKELEARVELCLVEKTSAASY